MVWSLNTVSHVTVISIICEGASGTSFMVYQEGQLSVSSMRPELEGAMDLAYIAQIQRTNNHTTL